MERQIGDLYVIAIHFVNIRSSRITLSRLVDLKERMSGSSLQYHGMTDGLIVARRAICDLLGYLSGHHWGDLQRCIAASVPWDGGR